MPDGPQDDLLARAEARVSEVEDDPEARLRLRERFYARHATGPRGGHGRSELDFIRWQIERGLLRPLRAGGSPYWRATQARVSRDAEHASLALEAGARDLPPGPRAWLDWLEGPSPERWYRAHNVSLVHGMRASVEAADAEPEIERRLINRALHRVLRAEVLARGGARFGLGPVVRRIADPRGPTVRLVTRAPWLYPRRYPVEGRLPRVRWSLERAVARWLLDRATLEEVSLGHVEVLCPTSADPKAALREAATIYPRETA